MRDDLVDREHGMRRRENQVLHPHVDRLRRAELDRLRRDPLCVLCHLCVLCDFPAAGLRLGDERARARLAVLARRHREGRRRRERFLLDVGALARGEVLPLVLERDAGVHGEHVLVGGGEIHDLLDERLLLLLRDLRGILDHRRRPVVGVRRHGRQPDVDFFRDGARLGDLARHPGDAPDFVLVDDGTAGEAPDAAVDHADAEACRLPAAGPFAGIAAAEAAASASPAATASAAATPAQRLRRITVSTRRVDAVVRAAREADVGIRASELLRLDERHVRHSLELRFEDAPLRRLRQQIGDGVARGERDARHGHGLYEIATIH